MKKYIKFSKNELIDLFYIVLVISFLFSLSFKRFVNPSKSLFSTFIIFFIFFFILFFLRFLFMKIISYKNGFEIKIYMTYFDRYWIRNFDRLSYSTNIVNIFNKDRRQNLNHFKGIPTPILSLIIYIFSLGLIIFVANWRFKFKQIPHKFKNTFLKYEINDNLIGTHNLTNISDYRKSKVFFLGFMFYFIFVLFLKFFCNILELNYFNWFFFSTYYIAFFSLIPIFGTEGHEFFFKGYFGWFSTITILLLSFISILILKSTFFVILTTFFAFFIFFVIINWRELM